MRLLRLVLGELSAPERLSGALWGILIVLSATGSVGILRDGEAQGTGVILLAGLGAALAWAIVEASMTVFEAVVTARAAGSSVRRGPVARSASAAALVQLAGAVLVLAPLALPWPVAALRLSHAVAVLLLAAIGWRAGVVARGRPWAWSLAMVALGGAVVGLLLALEG